MREYLEIGCCPSYEEAVQTTDEDYAKKAMKQCKEYIGLLRDMFGREPEGAVLRVKGFQHDFGTYYEVVCYYSDVISQEYAFMLEKEQP